MKKLFLFVLIICTLTACSDKSEPFTRQDYSVDASQVSEVCIDVRDRQIDVEPSGDGQIHIGYFDNSKEFYDISLSEGKVLTMTAKSDKNWQDYVGVKGADSHRIKLQVPEGALDSLRISTTNENVSLAPLAVMDHIALSVNGGSIAFERLDVGKAIELSGKNGDISGTIVGRYDDFAISCDVKKGENNLPKEKKGGEKTLTIANNNGDISVEFEGRS